MPIRRLRKSEIHELLRRQRVARIAYSFRDRVDIEPIHYVYADDAFYVRTSEGEKLETLRHNPWVAIEVDEIRGLYSWRSVVAKGTVELIESPKDEATFDHITHARALKLLRRLIPAALKKGDPTPWRDHLVCIHVREIEGRTYEKSKIKSRS
jgi:nitroimidazol reductase NimA-like FMN-containing flavoprotein (pyridoxamine 5'-phosphate oxidase superfamily)